MGSKNSALMPFVTAVVFIAGLIAGYYFVILPVQQALGIG